MRSSDLEASLKRLAPRIPRFEREAVLDHAMASPGLRTASPEEAVWLSLVAFVRHAMTDYDSLLTDGYDPESARHFVAEEMREILTSWGTRRPL